MIKNLHNILNKIIKSKIFNVFLILLVNIGSSYIANDLQDVMSYIFSSYLLKTIVIFAICFTSTNDIFLSIIVSCTISILLYEILNVKSKFCILSKKCINNIESFKNKKKKD